MAKTARGLDGNVGGEKNRQVEAARETVKNIGESGDGRRKDADPQRTRNIESSVA